MLLENIFPPSGTSVTLKQNPDSTWTMRNPDGSEDHFDSSGRYSQFRSPAGDRWTWTFDGGGRVATVTQPTGGRTTFAYDGSNNLKRTTDVTGRVTTFVVDGSGNLTKKICPELCTTEMRYDANHLLTSLIDSKS